MTIYVEHDEDTQGDLVGISYYCSQACWIDGTVAPRNGGRTYAVELDAPAYCETCGGLVDVSLTSHGIAYVLEHLDSWAPAKMAELVKVYDLRSEAIAIKYREHRGNGIPAKPAYVYAARYVDSLADALDPDEWNESSSGLVMELERYGFKLVVRAEPDYDHEATGTFTDSWSVDAVRVPPSWACRPSAFAVDWAYYVPMVSYSEHRDGLRKLGYSRHAADCLARSYVLRDMYAEGSNEREVFGLIVTASREDVELGSTGLWGIDLGTEATYSSVRRDLARDVLDYGLIEEVIAEARASLARLKVAAD